METAAFSGQAKERGYNLEIKEPEALRKEMWADYKLNENLVKQLGMAKK